MKSLINGKTYTVFFPWSELVDTGLFTEDGRRVIDTVWWIVGENSDGYRIRTIDTYKDEFEATCKAKIFNDVNNDGNLDVQLFEEIDPAYGSRAYVFEDIEYLRMIQERREEREDF